MLADDLGGDLQCNFNFTNYTHADSHGIRITDNLLNYYKSHEVPR